MIRPVIQANAFDCAARIAVENGRAGDILILKLALPFQARSRTCLEFMNKADVVVHGALGAEEASQRGRTANRLIGDGRQPILARRQLPLFTHSSSSQNGSSERGVIGVAVSAAAVGSRTVEDI